MDLFPICLLFGLLGYIATGVTMIYFKMIEK
jgi:hypothetical protein